MAVLFSVLLLLSCGPRVTQADSYSSPMLTETIGTQAIKATRTSQNRQWFNKICRDEGISSSLDNWAKAAFKAYEDQKGVIEYYFIKEDTLVSTVYKLDLEVVDKDTLFILETRKTLQYKNR